MNCFNVGLSDYSLSAYAKVAAFSFDQSVMLDRLIFTPCSYQHAAGASLQSRSLCPIQPLLHPLSLPPSVSILSAALLLMSCNNTHTLCSQRDRSGWQVKYCHTRLWCLCGKLSSRRHRSVVVARWCNSSLPERFVSESAVIFPLYRKQAPH